MPDLRQIAKESRASQGKEELFWLLEKVAKIKPRVILEIGVHLGYSLDVWQEAFQPKILIGIDNEMDSAHIASRLNVGSSLIVRDSHSVQALYDTEEDLHRNRVDFLFIDGDHTYAGVKQDFEMYAPLVKKGGIIAFDDMDLFDNPTVEVYQFWNEVKDKYKSEWLHSDSNGLGILHV